jgi:phospholipase C
MPQQEKGTRPARAVPYELHAAAEVENGTVELEFRNSGKATAVFQVRSGNSNDAPRSYTVSPNKEVSDTWAVASLGSTAYDLSVYGPNGFFREFKGSIAQVAGAQLEVRAHYERKHGELTLELRNTGGSACEVSIRDAYRNTTVTLKLRAHETAAREFELSSSHGWYDLLVEVEADAVYRRQLAGHVETGRDSVTDPAIASS